MTTVAIIGAGIIGAALADQLARLGASVTVLDSRPTAEATSSSSLAWLNANQKLPRNYHEFSVEAMRAWQELAEGIGRPGWYRASGGLTWAVGDDDHPELVERIDRLRSWGYPAQLLTFADARKLEPQLHLPDEAVVARFPSEGYVHGESAVTALLARARESGARVVRTGADATIRIDDGRISALRVAGDTVKADVYVCCAGWRTNYLLESADVAVPLVQGDEVGSSAPCLVVRTSGQAPLGHIVHAPALTMRPTEDGLHLEASDLNATVDANTTPETLNGHGRELLRRARQVLPGYDGVVTDARICIRPLPVDGHPIVGWLPSLPNAYLAVTHSGITLAPLIARLAAKEIRGCNTEDALASYRPSRFPG